MGLDREISFVCGDWVPKPKLRSFGDFNNKGPKWSQGAQGLRGSARQGKGTQGTLCGCPKGTAVAGANQAMGPVSFAPICFAARATFLNDG